MAVSRRVRAAWIVGGSVFAIVTLSFGTVQAVAALAHEEHSFTTTIDGVVRAVDIEASGSVTVLGTDNQVVTIDERVSDGLQHPDRSTALNQGVLVVRGTCGGFPATFCGDDIVLRVPREASVRVEANGVRVAGVRGAMSVTSDGGDIRVRGAAGELWLRSHGGRIDARALRVLRVDAESNGGNISLGFASPPRHVDASSHGGNIFVALPDEPVSYRVRASAEGGSTDTPIRTDPSSRNTIRAESHGGGVAIRYAGTGHEVTGSGTQNEAIR